jgi:hypothetical protein
MLSPRSVFRVARHLHDAWRHRKDVSNCGRRDVVGRLKNTFAVVQRTLCRLAKARKHACRLSWLLSKKNCSSR